MIVSKLHIFKEYNLISFYVCAQPLNNQHSQDSECIHPQSLVVFLCKPYFLHPLLCYPSSSPPPAATTGLLSVTVE